MDSKAKAEEIVRLLDQLKRATEETRDYINKSDRLSALRNHNDSRDELQRLSREWEELTRLLEES